MCTESCPRTWGREWGLQYFAYPALPLSHLCNVEKDISLSCDGVSGEMKSIYASDLRLWVVERVRNDCCCDGSQEQGEAERV
jgi:hypothetical protein